MIEQLDSPLRDIFQLQLLTILEACSFTSKDGQFLRLIKDKATAEPDDALSKVVAYAERDIQLVKPLRLDQRVTFPAVHLGDSRDLSSIPFDRKPIAH